MKKIFPITLQEALDLETQGEKITLRGWVKNKRLGKNISFIVLQDGSTQEALQVVMETKALGEEVVGALQVGSSIEVEGKLVESAGRQQNKELQGETLRIVGDCPVTYPLQPKRHTLHFLRTLQHLRFRTSTFRAIFRVRHVAARAVHNFFDKEGFVWMHTPIITDVDTEGAGDTFEVITGRDEKKGSFFGGPAYLTVSGQLGAEAAALGMGRVYTFGPTFRAENSHTTRHLSEFWMIEPEMAFFDLKATIALAEKLLKEVVKEVVVHCKKELDFLSLQKEKEEGTEKTMHLREKLEGMCKAPFVEITYTKALEVLAQAHKENPKRFVYPVGAWGMDLQKEHENYLTAHFGGVVVVTHYPTTQKPFYMRKEDDRTVRAMDILFPQIGEMVGGSQREERLEELIGAMKAHGLDEARMAWYVDTRRFGSVPHSGFGIGFERLLQYLTGMENIRDVIPFPRYPGQLQY